MTKESPMRKGIGRFLICRRSSENATTPTRAEQGTVETTTASPSPSPLRKDQTQQNIVSGPIADFIQMTDVDELIEDLRRIAELCVIGENFVTKIQEKHDMAEQRAQRKWAAARDALLGDVSESEPAYDESS
jgi:hypothetical protein